MSMLVDLCFSLELILVAGIMIAVPYTEVDWRAYMDEVAACMEGERDYSRVSGGTGPLVYPAGFVWLFSGLRWLTKGGDDIGVAQCIYAVVYLMTLSVVLKLYKAAGVSAAATVPLFFSKRLRSVYMLRLFNDCWAVLLALMAVLRVSTIIGTSTQYLKYRHWYWGCLLMSVAISVKMNILLFCPGLLCILLHSVPMKHVFICGTIGASWQLLVALPFLIHAPESYLGRAFELRRVFQHRWSVNYQFLPVTVFEDARFHTGLLCSMIGCYALMWQLRWRGRCEKAVLALKKREMLHGPSPPHNRRSGAGQSEELHEKGAPNGNQSGAAPRNSSSARTAEHYQELCDEEQKKREQMLLTGEVTCIAHVLTLFESNLIGVAFSRSMHYQFLPWFFFTVMFVLYHTRLQIIPSLACFWAIQYGFEVYPPSPFSSALVMAGFAGILVAMLCWPLEPGSRRGEPIMDEEKPRAVPQNTTTSPQGNEKDEKPATKFTE